MTVHADLRDRWGLELNFENLTIYCERILFLIGLYHETQALEIG